MELRQPKAADLSVLTELCLRSKAYWGYDEEFMRACRNELTVSEADLADTVVVLAEEASVVLGVAQVSVEGQVAWLEKLFVAPEAMGRGLGRRLYQWSVEAARARGADRLVVEADPEAATFYRHLGATPDGTAPSGSIPGRRLPRLVQQLNEP